MCLINTLFIIFVLELKFIVMRYRLFLFLFVVFLASGLGIAQPIFKEAGGILRVDVTSTTSPLGQWVLRDSLAGAIDGDYLEFEGPNFFNAPGNSTLTYKIRITTTGTYLFNWRSRITEPNETTEYNDSWLRCPDADLFYAERSGSRVFPRGSGRTPNPEGSSRENWFKVYQNRANEWFWRASTSDRDPHSIYMQFDNPGDYTIEIAGRSKGHAIDRFVLIHSSAAAAAAQDLAQPESDRVTTSVATITTEQLRLYPNPASNFLNFPTPAGLPAGDYNINIHDQSGKRLSQLRLRLNAGQSTPLDVHDLPHGAYFLTLTAGNTIYRGRFVK